ncbi:hypothetical protein DAPPUDRAFT_316213 [Daphnia pulex]|uniref:CUB domain-containing protein n=1 Tax=Daphnia pulex TaxID=6669 RepID=E9GC65_DAPPU|nr:hypothetical protein DAPPUDRAFT_316213 [Daphnia pulex]|eukprot:EFX82500.1 hypothetical protein DAPPUDRAFT_316213 [Daphnia pulex]
MSKFFLILTVILALASNCCGLDTIEEELLEDVIEEEDPVDVDESFFQRANRFLPYPNPFPWRRWSPLHYQPRSRIPFVNYGYNNAGLFRQFDSALENPFGNQLGLMTPQLPIDSEAAAADLILNSGLLQNVGEFRQLVPAVAGDSCKSPTTKESGICSTSAVCTAGGGRVSGSCSAALACCIRVINSCDDGFGRQINTVTLNNTYWQSPVRTIAPSSSCSMTVQLDSTLPEQAKQQICQIRLDFVLFTISQPDAETACSGDFFEVAGATNIVPTICGFNNGQHMYLHVPPSPTDVQLSFNFGPSDGETRQWNILIAMIPCSSKVLAPPDCLQYFSTRTGSVKTFNWRDVDSPNTRQLANQDYSICFRSGSAQRQMCVTPCAVVTAQKPFSISTPIAIPAPEDGAHTADVSQLGSLNCNNDYLVIPGAFNLGNPTAVANMAFDRFCGERLNALPGNAASTTVCTTATPFRMLYRTNRDETLTTPTVDTAESGNRGFCLNFRIQ